MTKYFLSVFLTLSSLVGPAYSSDNVEKSQMLPELIGNYNPQGNWVLCRTNIKNEWSQQVFDGDDPRISSNRSIREKWLGVGMDITCPSWISLRALTPEMTDQQRQVFCLQFDESKGTYLGYSQGERDAYSRCKVPSKPLCEYVNESKDAALAIAGLGAGTAATTLGAQTAVAATGVSAVAHSSGAVILTGSAGYIAGTLGTVGATALSVLTAPATLAGASVTLVAAGGAVYFCHPEKLTN